MLDKYERPVKIVCLLLAALLAWQLGSAILGGDPLKNLKIPPLPALLGATNEPAKSDQKKTDAAAVTKTGTNGTSTNLVHGTNAVKGTNVVKNTNAVHATYVVEATHAVHGTNVVKGTNAVAKSTNNPAPGGTNQVAANAKPKRGGRRKPGMMGMMGGMPDGAGVEKIPLPTNTQARVDNIIDSEIFGPLPRPMPLALLGIADQEAFIQATNGQTGGIKVGDEIGGVKLLRIGINRVLVELGGEKQELTIFDGFGGESLMPKTSEAPSTNAASTHAPASGKKPSAGNAKTNQTILPKQKENP